LARRRRSPAGPSKAHFWKELRTRAKYGTSVVCYDRKLRQAGFSPGARGTGIAVQDIFVQLGDAAVRFD
jgi:hypothetical protein